MTAVCPCGAALSKPGPTGLCRSCVVKRPKSAETRERMRAAAIRRESDLDFRERRVAAARAGVAASMRDPAERQRRVDWGRQMGRQHGAAMAAQLGPAGSPKRLANGRKGSLTKLAWCPLEYRETYRELMAGKQHSFAEVRQMILDQIEVDRRRFLSTGKLPQAERAGR